MIEAFLLVGSHVKSLAIGGQQWLKPCHWLVALLEAVPLAGFNSEQMLVPQHFKLTTLWQLEYKMRQYDLAACLFFCAAWRCPEFFFNMECLMNKKRKKVEKDLMNLQCCCRLLLLPHPCRLPSACCCCRLLPEGRCCWCAYHCCAGGGRRLACVRCCWCCCCRQSWGWPAGRTAARTRGSAAAAAHKSLRWKQINYFLYS